MIHCVDGHLYNLLKTPTYMKSFTWALVFPYQIDTYNITF